MSAVFMISDAAKKVEVEAHVLRYWEEELELPIKRNELGHRYYTEEDVRRFQEIKELKERGLQLKAIRMVLKDGKFNVLPEQGDRREEKGTGGAVAQESADSVEEISPITPARARQPLAEDLCRMPRTYQQTEVAVQSENQEEKAQRLQWLLKQLFRETLQENNEYLCREMKESILKELDYQFRMQEEREDERNAEKLKREEEHYKKIDELLRKKRRLLKK